MVNACTSHKQKHLARRSRLYRLRRRCGLGPPSIGAWKACKSSACSWGFPSHWLRSLFASSSKFSESSEPHGQRLTRQHRKRPIGNSFPNRALTRQLQSLSSQLWSPCSLLASPSCAASAWLCRWAQRIHLRMVYRNHSQPKCHLHASREPGKGFVWHWPWVPVEESYKNRAKCVGTPLSIHL